MYRIDPYEKHNRKATDFINSRTQSTSIWILPRGDSNSDASDNKHDLYLKTRILIATQNNNDDTDPKRIP